MRSILFFTVVGTIGFATGCATSPKTKCKAAVSHSPTEYDVCIGDKQVKAGDKVEFFEKHCSVGGKNAARRCHNEKLGEGLVIKTLDEDLSTIKLDSEFEITESTIIEKKK